MQMLSWDAQRREFVRVCRRALHAGMQTSSGGNLSMKLREDRFLVKPSGIALYDVQEQDLLICDGAGTVMEGGGRPTKEIRTHLSIYHVREDIGGIVHYHSPYATTYAVNRREIPLLTVHARRILGKIRTVPPGPEGSDALAEAVQRAFEDEAVSAVLLLDHGVLAAGSSIKQAQNVAELVEESAHIAYLSRLFGAVSS
jgi:L-ribulose-5-phosphate 4-epimerase